MFYIILLNNNILSDRYKLLFEPKNKALTYIHNYYKSNKIKSLIIMLRRDGELLAAALAGALKPLLLSRINQEINKV